MVAITTEQKKFADIPLGSRVRVSDNKHEIPSYDGTVIRFAPEIGRAAIPGLFIDVEGDERLVTGSGRFRVDVLIDGDLVNRRASGAVRVILEPYETDAIRFTGGIESAVEVVRWAPGEISYQPEDGKLPEFLQFTLNGIGAQALAGDWLVRAKEGYLVKFSDDEFHERYQILH